VSASIAERLARLDWAAIGALLRDSYRELRARLSTSLAD